MNVTLYTLVFYESGLYSDMGLQVVYLGFSIYGWYEWLHGGANRSRLHVSRATLRAWAISGVLAVAFWLVWGRYMATLKGVALPYLDAGLATLSLVAQWMMTRKILENWILWILADIVYVPMYVYKSLYVTAGLYAVFLVLAILGLVGWRRSYARDRAVASRPAPAPA